MAFYSKKNGQVRKLCGRIYTYLASAIGFTPPTGMSATDVQGAVEEVNTKVNDCPLNYYVEISANTIGDFLTNLTYDLINNATRGKGLILCGKWSLHDYFEGNGFVTSIGDHVGYTIRLGSIMYYCDYWVGSYMNKFSLTGTIIS